MNSSPTLDEDFLEEKSRLKGDELTKTKIQRLQREIDTYKQMKHEEAESKSVLQGEGGISDGRRRWFNRRIDEKRKKIQELEEEL